MFTQLFFADCKIDRISRYFEADFEQGERTGSSIYFRAQETPWKVSNHFEVSFRIKDCAPLILYSLCQNQAHLLFFLFKTLGDFAHVHCEYIQVWNFKTLKNHVISFTCMPFEINALCEFRCRYNPSEIVLCLDWTIPKKAFLCIYTQKASRHRKDFWTAKLKPWKYHQRLRSKTNFCRAEKKLKQVENEKENLRQSESEQQTQITQSFETKKTQLKNRIGELESLANESSENAKTLEAELSSYKVNFHHLRLLTCRYCANIAFLFGKRGPRIFKTCACVHKTLWLLLMDRMHEKKPNWRLTVKKLYFLLLKFLIINAWCFQTIFADLIWYKLPDV